MPASLSYEQALAAANAAWTARELAGLGGGAPPVIAAVAAVTGIDTDVLWDHVEGERGWEPHDGGYEGAVWESAEMLRPPPEGPAR